jgi:hypothetical protein
MADHSLEKAGRRSHEQERPVSQARKRFAKIGEVGRAANIKLDRSIE